MPRSRRELSDTVWAPLADTMTLVSCVFLVIFVAILVAYADAQSKTIKAVQAAGVVNRKFREDGELIRKGKESAANALAAAKGEGIEVADGRLLLGDKLLFNSGSDKLSDVGLKIIQGRVASAIAKAVITPNESTKARVLIEGHTDSEPTRISGFKSNWELSTSRATNVLRAVLEAHPEIPCDRVFAAGFAHTMPRGDYKPDDPRNRRVEIRIKVDIEQLLVGTAGASSIAPGAVAP